ncbi:MAG: glycerophosphodiester phosphodiesterase [Acidimicrobiia bacterium]|nr:glycerophosphodiester phosphodiesterase [Acidimicrobiia bacterium]
MSRAGKIILGAGAGVAAAIAALYTTAWLRSTPIEHAAFFTPHEGENRLLVFAHQGGEGAAPSNTMIAFRKAAGVGADVLDADLHMSAEGELVLIHDETVDRTSNGTGAVRDLTLAELRTLDFGYQVTAIDGHGHPFRGQGVGIVTAEELFTEFGYRESDGAHVRFGIEIKQTTAEAATRFCDLIRRFGYEDRVLVSSFEQPNMDVFRAACPEVATSATEDEVRTFYILHRLGLEGLIQPAYESFQVPEYSGDILILAPGFVDAAQERNIAVIPWTINDADDLGRMIDLGVTGINTDHPDRLLDLLTAG